MSTKGSWDSGRIETLLAGVVLLVVFGLFLKFNALDEQPVPEPPVIETRSETRPSGPTSTTGLP